MGAAISPAAAAARVWRMGARGERNANRDGEVGRGCGVGVGSASSPLQSPPLSVVGVVRCLPREACVCGVRSCRACSFSFLPAAGTLGVAVSGSSLVWARSAAGDEWPRQVTLGSASRRCAPVGPGREIYPCFYFFYL